MFQRVCKGKGGGKEIKITQLARQKHPCDQVETSLACDTDDGLKHR